MRPDLLPKEYLASYVKLKDEKQIRNEDRKSLTNILKSVDYSKLSS